MKTTLVAVSPASLPQSSITRSSGPTRNDTVSRRVQRKIRSPQHRTLDAQTGYMALSKSGTRKLQPQSLLQSLEPTRSGKMGPVWTPRTANSHPPSAIDRPAAIKDRREASHAANNAASRSLYLFPAEL